MKNILLCSIIVSTVALSGCQTTDPYTGEQKTTNTAKGVGIGAVVGGVLGNVIGKNSKGTAIGAVVGSTIGAVVGANMDEQEAELRKNLNDSGIRVERDSAGVIKLIMPSNITFETNKSEVTPSFVKTLAVVSEVLARNENTTIKVVGHTDSVGSKADNEMLSINRSMSVFHTLTSQGVASSRIKAIGKGETQPVASNDNANGRALNRRVELFIVEIPTQG